MHFKTLKWVANVKNEQVRQRWTNWSNWSMVWVTRSLFLMRSCLYVLCLQVSDGVTYLCLLSTLFHWCLRFFRQKCRNHRLGRHRTRIHPVNTLDHRLNMELDLQSLFELHVHSCTHWLRPRKSLPPHLGSYTRALMVSQDRRHLFTTPCIGCMVMNTFFGEEIILLLYLVAAT